MCIHDNIYDNTDWPLVQCRIDIEFTVLAVKIYIQIIHNFK